MSDYRRITCLDGAPDADAGESARFMTATPGDPERIGIPEMSRPSPVGVDAIIQREAENMAAVILSDERAAMAAALRAAEIASQRRALHAPLSLPVVLIVVGSVVGGFCLDRLVGTWGVALWGSALLVMVGVILGYEDPSVPTDAPASNPVEGQ